MFPIKDKDFIIEIFESNDMEQTIVRLYNRGVRLFFSSFTSSQLTLAQDIFHKYKYNDALIFDSASSAYLPRKNEPNNIFRYNR